MRDHDNNEPIVLSDDALDAVAGGFPLPLVAYSIASDVQKSDGGFTKAFGRLLAGSDGPTDS